MTDWDAELSATAQGADIGNEPPPDAEAAARKLASLSALEYDQRREDEAKRLHVRVKTLDDAVRRHRGEDGHNPTGTEPEPFTDPEPFADPVDGAELLNEIAATFTRFLVLPEHSAEAMALWCLHAHAHDAADISPILAILSPTKRCGKTTTIKAVSALVPRPMHAVNISAAVLFRVVESYKPTVLVDEGDSFLRESDELRGIINGGHDRLSAYVWRNQGDDHEPKRFRVWAPKAIAMIGRLPDTLEDRAVVVPLRRRRTDETVERFRSDRIDAFMPLLSKAARWAADNRVRLAAADPDIPDSLDDRAQDNWRILIAIADAAGGEWPYKVRAAALALSSETARDEDTLPPGIRLLRDMKSIIGSMGEMSSSEIVEGLIELEEAPWREWRRGNPITRRGRGD